MNWPRTEDDNIGLFSGKHQAIPLQGVCVHGHITGRSAKVTVSQSYCNAEPSPVEAIYKFPLPDESAVCGFRIKKDGKTLTGVMEERNEAFKQYDQALDCGDRSYLLDQERPNIFTLSVGNLEPQGQITVEIDFVAHLDANGAEVRFMLPTTIAPRYVPATRTEPDGMPTVAVVNPPILASVNYGLSIKLSIDGAAAISALECPSHMVRYIHEENTIIAEFTTETVQMDRDFVLNIKYKDTFTTHAFACRNEGGLFIQVEHMQPKQKDTLQNAEGREVVFVVDCSGSMEGTSIEQAKCALEILLRGLPHGVSFNVYRFGSNFDKFFPASLQNNELSVKQALERLKVMHADFGGTEVMAPLMDIYAISAPEKGRDIILLTDGDIGNEGDIMGIAAKHRATTRLSIIGIGHGPNEFLIRQAAKSGGGTHEMIAPGERLEPNVLRLVAKILSGKPIKVTLGITGPAELAPSEAIVFGGETISLFARLQQVSEAFTSISLNLNGEEVTVPVVAVTDPAVPISTLWARQMILKLEDIASVGGSRQADRKQTSQNKHILELAMKYSLMSSQTSFVLMETVSDELKSDKNIELRRIPVALTSEWGNIRSYSQRCAMAVPRIPCSMVFMPSLHLDESYEAERVNSEEDLVYEILKTQQPQGGFEVTKELVNWMLNEDRFDSLNKKVQMITAKAETDTLCLFWTMVVFRVLETRGASYVTIWEPLVEKSRKWLNREIEITVPELDGTPLGEFVADVISNVPLS